MRLAHALLATLLLTGGRKSEVLGLELDDISFDRKTVTFRPNP
jgi:integrase